MFKKEGGNKQLIPSTYWEPYWVEAFSRFMAFTHPFSAFCHVHFCPPLLLFHSFNQFDKKFSFVFRSTKSHFPPFHPADHSPPHHLLLFAHCHIIGARSGPLRAQLDQSPLVPSSQLLFQAPFEAQTLSAAGALGPELRELKLGNQTHTFWGESSKEFTSLHCRFVGIGKCRRRRRRRRGI
jgi:hypothetical protein